MTEKTPRSRSLRGQEHVRTGERSAKANRPSHYYDIQTSKIKLFCWYVFLELGPLPSPEQSSWTQGM